MAYLLSFGAVGRVDDRLILLQRHPECGCHLAGQPGFSERLSHRIGPPILCSLFR
jgi:hypothetical protein